MAERTKKPSWAAQEVVKRLSYLEPDVVQEIIDTLFLDVIPEFLVLKAVKKLKLGKGGYFKLSHYIKPMHDFQTGERRPAEYFRLSYISSKAVKERIREVYDKHFRNPR